MSSTSSTSTSSSTSPTPSTAPSTRASSPSPSESGSSTLKRKHTPKEFTDFIQSQCFEIASSVDWGTDKESEVSAVNSLIDLTSELKKKVQNVIEGSESDTNEKEDTQPPSLSPSTASQTPSKSSSKSSRSSQDSTKPPWERQSRPKAPPSSSPQSTSSTSSSTSPTPNPSTARHSASLASSTTSATKGSSMSSPSNPADNYCPTPVTELATSVMCLRGDGDRPEWRKGRGRQTADEIKAYDQTAPQRLKAKLEKQAKANAKGEIGIDCC